jgi:hypothetical protein
VFLPDTHSAALHMNLITSKTTGSLIQVTQTCLTHLNPYNSSIQVSSYCNCNHNQLIETSCLKRNIYVIGERNSHKTCKITKRMLCIFWSNQNSMNECGHNHLTCHSQCIKQSPALQNGRNWLSFLPTDFIRCQQLVYISTSQSAQNLVQTTYKRLCLSFSAISRSNRKILSLYWPAVKRHTHVKAKKGKRGKEKPEP